MIPYTGLCHQNPQAAGTNAIDTINTYPDRNCTGHMSSQLYILHKSGPRYFHSDSQDMWVHTYQKDWRRWDAKTYSHRYQQRNRLGNHSHHTCGRYSCSDRLTNQQSNRVGNPSRTHDHVNRSHLDRNRIATARSHTCHKQHHW